MKSGNGKGNGMKTCYVCNSNIGERVLSIPEMYYGLGESFNYLECSTCGSYEIEDIPEDLGKYYGDEYYSFQSIGLKSSWLKRFIRRLRTSYTLQGINYGLNWLGWLIAQATGHSEIVTRNLEWMKTGKINCASRIADIGCGEGEYLHGLYNEGFSNIYGFDPFLKQPCKIGRVGVLFNDSVGSLPDNLDFILMSHSIEHVADPRRLLLECRKKLSRDGVLLIKTPISDNKIQKKYGKYWVGFEAPRHLHVFSMHGIELLAKETRYTIVSLKLFTDMFNLLASEQNLRGIPLMSSESFFTDGEIELTENEIGELSATSRKMSQSCKGDVVSMLLRRSS